MFNHARSSSIILGALLIMLAGCQCGNAEEPPGLSVTTLQLPTGSQGSAYEFELNAEGGTPPYHWAVDSGALPAGLSLSEAGRLSGTPTEVGAFGFTVVVTDAAQPAQTVRQQLQLQVDAPLVLTIITAELPDAVEDTAYSASLEAVSGAPPYSWSVTAGALPPGLTLNANGVLSGTPLEVGSSTFTVEVTDAATPSAAATRSFTVEVIAELRIVTADLPAGVTDQPYSATVEAAGGVAPYSWSATGLPAGVVIDAATGALSGTPTEAGSFSVVFTVADAATPRQEVTLSRTLTVTPGLKLVTTSLPSGTQDVAYSVTVRASGGAAPYAWEISASGLPPGLSLSATTGEISGTPTATGTTTFEITVTDSSSPAQSAARSFTIEIRPPGSLAIAPASLPTATVGVSYSGSFSASGGTTPYQWGVVSGTFPPGLALDAASGAVSGTPSEQGQFIFVVGVTDASAPQQSASREFVLDVAAPLSVVTAALPDGVAAQPYSGNLQAQGGVPPYTWAVASGSLPTGLSLDTSTGEISGTAFFAGTRSFTVEVTDASSPARTASRSLSISISDVLQIDTASLPGGTRDVAYSATLAASGGKAPYGWQLDSGSLPTGLVLGADGALSGTPSAEGRFDFVVRVTDAANPAQSETRSLSIEIAPPLEIGTAAFPAAVVGVAYSATAEARGAQPPYSWAVIGGSLPAGLSVDGATGEISGTPNGAAGTSTFTLEVSDSSAVAQKTNRTLSLEVRPAGSLAITTSALDDAVTAAAYSELLEATGGTTPYTWAISAGALPEGLSLDATTGQLAGSATAAGTYAFQVRVTDAASQQYVRDLEIRVHGPLAITSASLPDAIRFTAYAATATATGGLQPYSWTLESGSLPAGFSLDAATGEITGTPITTGTSSFTLGVTDAASPQQVATRALSIKTVTALSISTSSLANGKVGTAYSASIAASGGTTPYAFTIEAGTLPAGLSMNASGAISGTPTTAGSSTFTVRVTDAGSPPQVVTRQLTLTVAP